MKLSELIEEYISGDWGNEATSEETPNEVFCIRGADFEPILSVDYTNIPTRYISDTSYKNKQLKVGDIIIEKSGGSPTQSTGRVILVTEDLLKEKQHIVCSNFCEAFRVKKEWHPFYVFSYLQFLYKEGVFFNFEGKTSGLKNLQMEQAFSSIDIPEQKSDISILASINNKIALNRKINIQLEVLAKEIFEYWFVQFDFPNEEGKPYKSSGGKMVWNEELKRDIPDGWDVSIIEDILAKVKTTQKLMTDEYLPFGTFPIIDQTSGVYFAGFTNCEEAVLSQFPCVVFGDHSCAVKFVNFPFARGADGTQIMIPNNEKISCEYLYFATKNINLEKKYARHFSIIKKSLIIIPPNDIAKKFKEKSELCFETITKGRFNIIELQSLCDYLLPLLMNGQIIIKD